jgi:hypothetical protein
MIAAEHPAAHVSRPRTMRDDLLHDLRQAAPLPIAPTEQGRSLEERTVLPEPLDPTVPTLELRLTLPRWSRPRVLGVTGDQSMVLSVGPVRLSATFRR